MNTSASIENYTEVESAEVLRRNAPETVSELSERIRKRLMKDFSNVQVRAELGRVTHAASGHIYIDLKDDKAVLNGVIWRQAAGKLKFRPETGMEVICKGRLNTYAPRSNYQLIIEDLQRAGEGALLAQLEERRRKLTAERLFDESHKRRLPYLPTVIGVVTSPKGAVIHDILHRLSSRFPRYVLLWPALMQGEKCADEVVAAIQGFDALPAGGGIPRPDLLIVARGGGSLEDLWPFNDERVVRAVFNCSIPLISAIGHESDLTLIDLAADKRAPTPTAAAEIAVPVQADLLNDSSNLERRLKHALAKRHERARERLHHSSRHLLRSGDTLALLSQRFDMAAQRFSNAIFRHLSGRKERFTLSAIKIPPYSPRKTVERSQQRVGDLQNRSQNAIKAFLSVRNDQWHSRSELLEAFSHQSVLERGFALVWAGKQLLSRASAISPGMNVELEFAGAQRVGATITRSASCAKTQRISFSKPPSGQQN